MTITSDIVCHRVTNVIHSIYYLTLRNPRRFGDSLLLRMVMKRREGVGPSEVASPVHSQSTLSLSNFQLKTETPFSDKICAFLA